MPSRAPTSARGAATMLALREVNRARVRFALLAGAVGLLVFLILFVQALTGALIRQFTGALDSQSAEVLVYSSQARKNLEGSVVSPEAVAEIASVPGVARAEPFGEGTFTGTVGGGELADLVVFGYVLGGPGKPTTLVEGRLPERDFEAVGSSADFSIGDVVTLARGGTEIEVVGLARDANFSVTPTLFTSFPTYQEARASTYGGTQAVPPSAVAVELALGASAEAVRDEINESVDGVEALTRAQAVDEAPGVASVSQSIGTVVFLCFFVVVVVAGLFFLILTVQKASALTLLRAIGVRGGVLVRALLVQVAVVVIAGVAIGGAIGVASLSATSNGLGARIDLAEVFRTGGAVLVLSALAALGAIRRVLTIEPVRATVPGGIGR